MIIHNRIACRICGDIIESKHRHDFVWCKCESVAVDGGKDYLKRCGDPANWTEMSEVTQDDREEG
jgi:hypothetical protein